MIAVGSMVSGYRVQRVLGTGGMGSVYAVVDPQLPRLDALKVMPAEFSADPEFRKRFLREADIAANLDHPNIVSVYDRGETADGQLWIAMQLVDGTDADAALRSGTMTAARAVHIIAAVGEALDYAHSRGVLHRDIKPANFLLSGPAGPDERVLLGDFGIARSADDAGITATNAVMTTMAYAAPEVLDGGRVDYRADLYSLGCALFHLLTGQTPYADTPGMAAQAMAHLQRPVPRPTAVAPGLPPEFDTVIATAMAKDPAQRFPSGRALANAADGALRAQSSPPRVYSAPGSHAAGPQPSWPTPVPESGRSSGESGGTSRRGKLIAALAGAVVIVGGSVTAVALTGDSEPGPAPAPPTSGSEPASAAPTVAAADLPGLLLSLDQVGAILGTAVHHVKNIEGFANDSAQDAPECVGLVYPLQEKSYLNSGATTGYADIVGSTGATGEFSSIQAVVSFPTAESAQGFIDRQSALWPGCAYKNVRISGSGTNPDTTWRLGASKYADGILTVVKTPDGAPLSCQRALTAAGTVVVDTTACLPSGLADQGVTIARQIADKVPQ